eukprot:09659_4
MIEEMTRRAMQRAKTWDKESGHGSLQSVAVCCMNIQVEEHWKSCDILGSTTLSGDFQIIFHMNPSSSCSNSISPNHPSLAWMRTAIQPAWRSLDEWSARGT